jgi:hypothetical protein
MVEEISQIIFSSVDNGTPSLSSREGREMLLQWNLDTNLKVKIFRFNGALNSSLSSDYDRLLKDFFRSTTCTAELGITGLPEDPLTLDIMRRETTVLTMDFFDKLRDADIVTPSGNIRGCYEEVFDGITVGDKLREMLLNQDSENNSLYSEDEKKQLIFHLFKIFAIGGAMCQPDNDINR